MRSIVHHCQLPLGVRISNGNSSSDRIEIVCDIAISLKVPRGPLIQNPLLHLQTVGISVKYLIIVEILYVEIGDNFVAGVLLLKWQRVEINLEFKKRKFVVDRELHFTLH